MMQPGPKKRQNRQPTMQARDQDSSSVTYSTLGSEIATNASGQAMVRRAYIPGNADGLFADVGPQIVRRYSTAKFLPGTKLRWEPSVGITTPGRVFVAFTDNPEKMEVMLAFIAGGNYTNFSNAIKGFGNLQSFPIWQETEIAVPSRLRRKMFDTNATTSAVREELDRSAQTCMFAFTDGAPVETFLGSFWYHDKLAVEGVTGVPT